MANVNRRVARVDQMVIAAQTIAKCKEQETTAAAFLK